MQFYIDVSMEIAKNLNRYVPKEAIHVYSVDESFIDLGGTERLWGDPEETVKRIQDELVSQYELRSACGMGPNMLMAKLCLRLQKLFMYMHEKRFIKRITDMFSNVHYVVHKY